MTTPPRKKTCRDGNKRLDQLRVKCYQTRRGRFSSLVCGWTITVLCTTMGRWVYIKLSPRHKKNTLRERGREIEREMKMEGEGHSKTGMDASTDPLALSVSWPRLILATQPSCILPKMARPGSSSSCHSEPFIPIVKSCHHFGSRRR